MKRDDEIDTAIGPDENCVLNSCNSARTQKGLKKKEDKKRDITKENQLDTDGICSLVVWKSNLYQDSRETACFINVDN